MIYCQTSGYTLIKNQAKIHIAYILTKYNMYKKVIRRKIEIVLSEHKIFKIDDEILSGLELKER